MLELYQLAQLLAIADCGTISKAAEQLHLSQPALSRSMQRLEEELQVTLFDRQKNKISLNKTGKLAVEQARRLMEQAQNLVEQVRSFERSQRTISIGSCAPVPMLELVSLVSRLYPEMAISSEMKDNQILLDGVRDGRYQLIVLPFPAEDPALICFPFEKEKLFFSLPPSHPLAHAKSLSFQDLDGESVLLLSQIGFWRDVCRQKMPLTRTLVQTEPQDFNELVQASALPCFASDLALKWSGKPDNRVIIPIVDKEASATYHFICKREQRKRWSALITQLQSGQWKG